MTVPARFFVSVSVAAIAGGPKTFEGTTLQRATAGEPTAQL